MSLINLPNKTKPPKKTKAELKQEFLDSQNLNSKTKYDDSLYGLASEEDNVEETTQEKEGEVINWDDEEEDTAPVETNKVKPKKSKLPLIILIVFILIAGIGAYFYLTIYSKQESYVEPDYLTILNNQLSQSLQSYEITIKENDNTYSYKVINDTDTVYFENILETQKGYIEKIDTKKGIYVSTDNLSFTLYLKPFETFIDDVYTDFIEQDNENETNAITTIEDFYYYDDANSSTYESFYSDEIDEKGNPNPSEGYVSGIIAYQKASEYLGDIYDVYLLNNTDITNFLQLNQKKLNVNVNYTFDNINGTLKEIHYAVTSHSLSEAINNYDRIIKLDTFEVTIKPLTIKEGVTEVHTPANISLQTNETIEISTTFVSTGDKKNTSSGEVNENKEENLKPDYITEETFFSEDNDSNNDSNQ
jgi:hypothetical protein